MSDDDYKNWLRENGAEPTAETAQSEAVKTIPWWAKWIMLMVAFKAVKYLIAATGAH
jgi:hypothetical protein